MGKMREIVKDEDRFGLEGVPGEERLWFSTDTLPGGPEVLAVTAGDFSDLRVDEVESLIEWLRAWLDGRDQW